jgi:hypothetical protein
MLYEYAYHTCLCNMLHYAVNSPDIHPASQLIKQSCIGDIKSALEISNDDNGIVRMWVYP